MLDFWIAAIILTNLVDALQNLATRIGQNWCHNWEWWFLACNFDKMQNRFNYSAVEDTFH